MTRNNVELAIVSDATWVKCARLRNRDGHTEGLVSGPGSAVDPFRLYQSQGSSHHSGDLPPVEQAYSAGMQYVKRQTAKLR
jgi:hypothetical protein